MIWWEWPRERDPHCLSCDSNDQVLRLCVSTGRAQTNATGILLCNLCRDMHRIGQAAEDVAEGNPPDDGGFPSVRFRPCAESGFVGPQAGYPVPTKYLGWAGKYKEGENDVTSFGIPADQPCDCLDCTIAGEPTH